MKIVLLRAFFKSSSGYLYNVQTHSKYINGINNVGCVASSFNFFSHSLSWENAFYHLYTIKQTFTLFPVIKLFSISFFLFKR